MVPCFEEADRFDTEAFDAYLGETEDINFVLVNDGSGDNTLEVLRGVQERWPDRVDVIDQQPNQGKAEAVRIGILAALDAESRYVGYWDADLATPLTVIEEASLVLDRYEGIEILLGARVALLGRDIDRKLFRHLAGRAFATAASITLDLPVYDTQCGAKLFRVTPTTRKLFEEPFLSRWIFDVEMLARHLKYVGHGDGLYELPLRSWCDVGESKVKPADFVRAAGEMAKIYQTYSQTRGGEVVRMLVSPFGRYTVAGACGAIGHYGSLGLLVELAHVSPTVATTVGAVVGAITNYVLNYLVVFSSRKSHLSTAPKFFLVALLGAVVNGGVMIGLNEKLGLHYVLAQIVCSVVVLVMGFTLNRSWTFHTASPKGN